MTKTEIIKQLQDNSIILTTDSLINCICERHEGIVIERAKRTWRVYIEGNSTLDAVGYEIYDALINLMVLLILENIKTIEDYINNNKINQ